jgi:DNA-binding response OmpR family regulator
MEELRVLLFNLPPELAAVGRGLLSRPPFVTEAVTRAGDLLRRLESIPYRLIILNMPGDGLEFKDILPTVRGSNLPSTKAALILLIPEERVEEHRIFLERGLNSLLPRTATPDAVEIEIARQTNVAPRVDTRIMVRLKAKIQAQNTLSMCQTANISSSGMLIISRTKLPMDTILTFELMVPGVQTPLSGEARVVRYTVKGKEKYEGMGMAFTALRGDGQRLLQDFLTRILAGGKA